jgi:hypothetical protein
MSNTVVEPEGKPIRKVRRISTKGEVFVKVGDEVEPDTVLVRGMVKNPEVHEVKIYAKLGIDTDQVKQYMLKGEGDEVKKDEAIAIYRAFFGRFTKVCRSPIDGIIEVLLEHGVAIIRGLPIPVEVDAHIPGRVVEVIPGEGAVVETRGVVLNGVFGVGGEERGELIVPVDESDEVLTAEAISDGQKGKILVGGALVTLEALRKAVDAGVKGIITGGIDQKDLTGFLGYEIGVGVTGKEETGLTVIVTEGFGAYPMEYKNFLLLKSLEGRQASIDGTTQIRQRMLRPEIIIPT